MSAASQAGFAENALAGRIALVTGAASGIGRSIAGMLTEMGAVVCALDRDAEALRRDQPVASVAGDRIHARVADLADLDALDTVVGEISDQLGPVTILVNAAGITGGMVMEMTRVEWEQVLRVDLTAPFLLTQAVGRRLVAAGQGGNIVNIGSSSAYRAVQSGAAYGAAKAGLASLTRTTAWELGPHGITANLIAPGLTRTPFTESAFGTVDALEAAVGSGPLENLLHRLSQPQDIAAVVGFLCLPASRQITGQVLHVSAGAVVASG